MPRPSKSRRICGLPRCCRFGPSGHSAAANAPGVTMTVDEFECIRLIDLAGMSQEQCAAQMNIARTTVQAIYTAARGKLAECLVNGKELSIAGGDYVLCSADSPCTNRRSGHCTHQQKQKENGTMKIAVTYEMGQIFQHFGHTAQFKLYTVEGGKVVSSQIVDTNGSGHGALAGFLKAQGVDTLICGGIGGGARAALDEAGIALYGGASGNTDLAVESLLAGTLAFHPNEMCAHHEGHAEGHTCGSHGCGGAHHCGE